MYSDLSSVLACTQGESGQDPEWLVGEKWRGLVTVAFTVGDKSYTADPFVLVPHDAL